MEDKEKSLELDYSPGLIVIEDSAPEILWCEEESESICREYDIVYATVSDRQDNVNEI